MNRNGDRPYSGNTLRNLLTELAVRLDVRDSTGALVDFNRTHRFRHTVATSLLNSGVPLHVLQRYLGHLTPTMSMTYAQTLQSTAEAEFLRYRKITADGREIEVDPRDLYDMLELDRRTDRILPNGYCLLPPRQVCGKGNACLTCDKFATDATFLPELKTQQTRTEATRSSERRQAFQTRTGQEMSEDNVWLAGRRQEHDALGRIILTLEETRLADGTVQAVRGAGVDARTDAITRDRDQDWERNGSDARQSRQPPPRRRRARPLPPRPGPSKASATWSAAASRSPSAGWPRSAGVSLDFLYRNTEIRQRVEQLRNQQRRHATGPAGPRRPRPAQQRGAHAHRPARRAQTPPPRGSQPRCGRRSKPPTARTSNSDGASAASPQP